MSTDFAQVYNSRNLAAEILFKHPDEPRECLVAFKMYLVRNEGPPAELVPAIQVLIEEAQDAIFRGDCIRLINRAKSRVITDIVSSNQPTDKKLSSLKSLAADECYKREDIILAFQRICETDSTTEDIRQEVRLFVGELVEQVSMSSLDTQEFSKLLRSLDYFRLIDEKIDLFDRAISIFVAKVADEELIDKDTSVSIVQIIDLCASLNRPSSVQTLLSEYQKRQSVGGVGTYCKCIWNLSVLAIDDPELRDKVTKMVDTEYLVAQRNELTNTNLIEIDRCFFLLDLEVPMELKQNIDRVHAAAQTRRNSSKHKIYEREVLDKLRVTDLKEDEYHYGYMFDYSFRYGRLAIVVIPPLKFDNYFSDLNGRLLPIRGDNRCDVLLEKLGFCAMYVSSDWCNMSIEERTRDFTKYFPR